MNINESFFTQIAKILALPALISDLKKAEKMVEEDDIEMLGIIQTMKFNANQLKEKLPDFCKRHPDSNFCKEKSK